MLKKMGCVVQLANDGLEAVEILEKEKFGFDRSAFTFHIHADSFIY